MDLVLHIAFEEQTLLKKKKVAQWKTGNLYYSRYSGEFTLSERFVGSSSTIPSRAKSSTRKLKAKRSWEHEFEVNQN